MIKKSLGKMSGFCGVEEKDYVLLKNLIVEFRRDDDGDNGAEEANGCFALCFWLYIDNCASFPSVMLVQVSQLLTFLNLPSLVCVCVCKTWVLMRLSIFSC